MIYVRPPNNLHQLAAFLETMNSIDASHIGYCGEEEEEIFDTLSHDFSDIDIEKSFVVAYEEDHLVGALGFDIDAEKEVRKYGDHLSEMGKISFKLPMTYGKP